LNGPGGTAAVNEWPTTGVNYGASTLRPLYPFLDGIYQKAEEANPDWENVHNNFQLPYPYPEYATWRGFRPGLRGTEMSGTWTLMFARPLSGTDQGSGPNQSPWAFVRQARLEFVYDERKGISTTYRPQVFSKGRTARSPGDRLLFLIEGSDFHNLTGSPVEPSQGAFVHGTYVSDPPQGGVDRSFGLALGSGSVDATVALVWSLSGTLADASGSAPAWLTANRYGMPAIPASTWSQVPPSPQPIISASGALATIFPPKTLDGARRLADSIRTVNPSQTLNQLASRLSTGSNT